MDTINRLSEYFKKFPGIGERQSKRFVYFLLHQNPNYLNELVSLINSLKKEISQCPSCHLFFSAKGGQAAKFCQVCSDERTDQSIIMIIEKDADYENLRGGHFYNGLYFILGGLVPLIEKDVENSIRTRELLKTIEERANNKGVKEVIIALSLNPQGEHTDMYLRKILSPLQEKYGFKISSLGRGLSTGIELEYSDSDTLKNALKNRS